MGAQDEVSGSEVVKRGSVIIRIIPSPMRKPDGRVYPRWFVAHYEGAKRVRQSFTDLAKARKQAEFIAGKLAVGDVEAAKLSALDRQCYLQALRIIQRAGRDDLIGVVTEAAAAIALLPSGVTLTDAVRAHVERNAGLQSSKAVREVIAEMLAAKDNAGLSDRHRDDLRRRLKLFGDAFQCPIGDLSGKLIQTYLDGLKGVPRTKLNHFRHIVTLIRWAVRRRLCPRDLLEELEGIELPRSEGGSIGIFSPQQLLELLEGTRQFRPDLLGWVTIAAFCGLRTAELMRLDWSMVKLDRAEPFVEVPAAKAKTASRRLVPLCQAAQMWLRQVPERLGPVSPYAEENKVLHSIRGCADRLRRNQAKGHPTRQETEPHAIESFQWVKNGLRHSFCSYRMAQIRDAARVALEAGNSPSMLFRNYRELVTPEEAERWFGLAPHSEGSVLLSFKEGL
jgi:integrase